MSNDTLGVTLRDVNGLLTDFIKKLESPDFRKQATLLLRGELDRRQFMDAEEIKKEREKVYGRLAQYQLPTPTYIVEADRFFAEATLRKSMHWLDWKDPIICRPVTIGRIDGLPIQLYLRFNMIERYCIAFYEFSYPIADMQMTAKFLDAVFPGVPVTQAGNFHRVLQIIKKS